MGSFCSGLAWIFLLLAASGFSAPSVAQTSTDAATSQSHHTSAPSSAMTQDASVQATESALAELPESPGAVQFNSQPQTSSTPSAPHSQTAATQPNSSELPPSQTPAANDTGGTNFQQPVGTAAAPAPVVSGTAAARPAGVAVAPAKQHRVRTIVIKVGAVAGAAVALGTVVALSAGTSSRPPGAH